MERCFFFHVLIHSITCLLMLSGDKLPALDSSIGETVITGNNEYDIPLSRSCVIITMVMKMKLDRLIGILTLLLQNRKTTAPELAKHFEVSRRTILRDIDTLSMAGIPIVATRGGDGGIAIMDGYKINHGVLTTDELQSLIAALKGLDSVSKQSNLENLMGKLTQGNAVVSLADSIVIDLSSYYKDSLSEKIALIKQAIAESRVISFDYYYEKGNTHREIEPYCIEFRWKSWYLFGWCRERKDFRRFKLNRLWELAITNEHFSRRAVPDDILNANNVFSEQDKQNKINIRFDKSVRFSLIEEYGLNCYEEDENGLLLSLNYTNKKYIFGWVLAFGDNAEILSPLNIREEFAEVAKRIYSKYQT